MLKIHVRLLSKVTVSTTGMNIGQSTPIVSVHRLRNPGKIPLEIIEVQSGSYLGEDDIERFEDIYGRSTPIERGVSVKTIAQ